MIVRGWLGCFHTDLRSERETTQTLSPTQSEGERLLSPAPLRTPSLGYDIIPPSELIAWVEFYKKGGPRLESGSMRSPQPPRCPPQGCTK